jgi:hypothetical protein
MRELEFEDTKGCERGEPVEPAAHPSGRVMQCIASRRAHRPDARADLFSFWSF